MVIAEGAETERRVGTLLRLECDEASSGCNCLADFVQLEVRRKELDESDQVARQIHIAPQADVQDGRIKKVAYVQPDQPAIDAPVIGAVGDERDCGAQKCAPLEPERR